jgi:hypothetical protein
MATVSEQTRVADAVCTLEFSLPLNGSTIPELHVTAGGMT